MKVAGIGVIFARGRGICCYEKALRQGWVFPGQDDFPSGRETSLRVYRVAQETVTDKAVLRGMRRADRFSKMAVLAAWDAVEDSGIVYKKNGSCVGIIVTWGPKAVATIIPTQEPFY